MFKRINIPEALLLEQKELNSFRGDMEAKKILEKEADMEKNIVRFIRNGDSDFSGIVVENPDPEKIFTLQAIKNICVRYRLRFLDADLFKGEIPYEAIAKAKRISNQTETELRKFKIMAPSRLFKLTDADADPLLFVPTTDGNYYLVHQWGTDFAWYKKITQFPTRSLETLVFTILMIALLIALLIPNNCLIPPSNMAVNNIFGYWGFHRISFFLHATILLCGITIFWWFAFHKNFSNAEWNKKTFN